MEPLRPVGLGHGRLWTVCPFVPTYPKKLGFREPKTSQPPPQEEGSPTPAVHACSTHRV